MSVALRLYEQLTEAWEDKTRTKLITDAFEQREDCCPHLIKGIRLKTKEVDRLLQTEIKAMEIQIENTDVRMTQAIHRQSLWVIGSVGAVMGGMRLLECFLAHLPPT